MRRRNPKSDIHPGILLMDGFFLAPPEVKEKEKIFFLNLLALTGWEMKKLGPVYRITISEEPRILFTRRSREKALHVLLAAVKEHGNTAAKLFASTMN